MNCCPICKNQYDLWQHVPILGVCNHSMCSSCGQTDKNVKCPGCPVTRSGGYKVILNFKCSSINNTMIDLIKMRQLSSTEQILEFVNGHGPDRLRLIKCTACGTIVEEDRVRFCRTCSDENESVSGESASEVEEIMKKSALCGSCFLDGPHKGHENAVWVPTKLRSGVEVAIENLRVASDLSEVSFREQCGNLSNGLNSIYHSMSQLKDRVKSSNNVGGFKKILETCQKELAALEAVKTHMSTQFKEQTVKIEEIKESLARLVTLTEE